jgi:hypothetical protein
MENVKIIEDLQLYLTEIKLTNDIAKMILDNTPPKTLSYGFAFDMATKVRRNIITAKLNSNSHMANLLDVGLNFINNLKENAEGEPFAVNFLKQALEKEGIQVEMKDEKKGKPKNTGIVPDIPKE